MIKRTLSAYSRTQKFLHWSMAILIVFNLLFASGIEELVEAAERGGSPPAFQTFLGYTHICAGLAILLLAVIRLFLRLKHGAPTAPPEEPRHAQMAAGIAHASFYLLFLAIPLTGIAAYYMEVDGAGYVHGEPLRLVMWLLIGTHLVASLAHHFYWKTDVLRRMV